MPSKKARLAQALDTGHRRSEEVYLSVLEKRALAEAASSQAQAEDVTVEPMAGTLKHDVLFASLVQGKRPTTGRHGAHICVTPKERSLEQQCFGVAIAHRKARSCLLFKRVF